MAFGQHAAFFPFSAFFEIVPATADETVSMMVMDDLFDLTMDSL